ncbi:translation initiation factor 1 (eIF-1/SUI1) [Alteromonadaceae bacterium Bs31]|nr:translation initiation factor 1 (eIF-1/SUI1) [Alteromonadaceae bacterium Bs31]
MSSKLVYSTETGRIKEEKSTSTPRGDGTVRIARETKGRKGKGVTLVSGFDMDEKALKGMAKSLKQLCGTGGTLKLDVIEIQGDQRDKIAEYLQSKGHPVKRVGG